MSIVVELSIARLAYGSADRSESLIRWTIQPHFKALWNPLSYPSGVLRHDEEPLDTTAISITSARLGSKSIVETFTNMWPGGSLERPWGAGFRPAGALESLISRLST